MNPADVPDDDDQFLGCDLSEYFGSDRLSDARRVVLTQLKYSVLHSNKPWTVARLCAVKKPGGVPVIGRLAEMFTRLGREIDAEQRLSRLTIALVSNRPVDADLKAALDAAQEALRGRPSGVYAGTGFAGLSSRQRDLLGRLRTASRLSSGDFTDFIRVLDVRGCGSGSRALQRLELGKELSGVVVDGPRATSDLVQLMHSCMMPEAADRAGIRSHDVLVALGASGMRSLFPFPSRLIEPAVRVQTVQDRQLVDTILTRGNHKVLAHGQPGVGKSTVIAGLEARLPAGSVVVTYDCYAAGEYLNPAEARHTARAVVQIVNEVALRTGSLPLVAGNTPLDEGVLWGQFQDRLFDACGTLPSDAVLAIVIDAADNSVTAAHRLGERSFIHRLWQLKLPDNARLVMTARSARRADLLGGTEVVGIEQAEIPAFDQGASSDMLRTVFPSATARQCVSFHRRSHGFARVQAYALGSHDASQTDRLSGDLDLAVERAGRGLSDLFDEILDTALSAIGDPEAKKAQVAALAAMARPTRVTTLADVLGVGEGHIDVLVHDLAPGLALIGDSVGFADEDFEQHVRDIVSDVDLAAAHGRFADHFYPRRHSDDEAAQRIGEHLFNADRRSALVNLVLTDGMPSTMSDGLRRGQTFRSRVGLALRLIARNGDRFETRPGSAASVDIVRLILAAADAARADSSHVETLRAAPELAVLHGDPLAIASILTRDESEAWRGKLHMRAAAVLAACGRRDEAVEQLAMADAWLRAWARQPERDRGGFDAADVARAALAAFVVHGAEPGRRLVSGWRPRRFVEQVTAEFLKLAPGMIPVKDVIALAQASSASSLLQAQAAVAYAWAGKDVPVTWVRRISAALDRLPVRRLRRPPSWGTAWCELALTCGVSKARVRRLLIRLGPDAPSHLSEFDAHANVRSYLQAACLEAATHGRRVDTAQLAAALEIASDRSQYVDRQRSLFKSACDRLAPLLSVRAECLVALGAGTDTGTAVETVIATVRQQTEIVTERSRYAHNSASDGEAVWFNVAIAAAVAARQAALRYSEQASEEASTNQTNRFEDRLNTLLDDLARAARTAKEDGAPWIWMRMAREILAHAPERGIGLIANAADGFETAALPANEIRDLLIEAADIVHRYDLDLAAELFERAVRAAEGIDADIDTRLRTAAHIAAEAASIANPAERASLARSLTDALEDATPFVYEPSERLPHLFVLEVAAQLHGPTGFATAFRWAHEQRTDLERALPAALAPMTACGSVDPANAFWLLRLLGFSAAVVDAARPIIAAAASTGRRSLAAAHLTTLAQWVARDINPEQRRTAAEALCKLADDLELSDLECVSQTRRLAQALRDLEPSEDPDPVRASRTWARDDKTAEDGTPLGQRMSSIEDDLARLADRYASDESIADYLVAVAAAVAKSARTATLDQLVELPSRQVPQARPRTVAIAIRELLTRWKSAPQIQAWAARRLPDFLNDYLPRLFTAGRDPDGAYVTQLALPAETNSLSPALVEATAVNLDSLTTTHLHAIARVLSSSLLDPQTSATVARTMLAAQAAGPNSPLGPQLARLRAARQVLTPPPDDPIELMAAALWSLLGHEDRRYRWLAAHTLRPLLNGGPGEPLLHRLWTLAHETVAGTVGAHRDYSSFRTPGLEFLSMSALQWLLLVIARVAAENPDVVAPIADELARCALDASYPHAATRELARHAALAVTASHPSALPAATIDRLMLANAPTSCSAAKTTMRSSGDAVETRFRFDYMDTVRYWFEPLAGIFAGIAIAGVARRADAWVTDRWGRTNTTAQDPWLARNEDAWSLTTNGHGSIPTVEITPRYLEYHALQCTAGELADANTPMRVDYRGADADDPWQEWLAKYMPQSPSLWRSDLRQPTPIRPITVGAWATIAPKASTAGDHDRNIDPARAVLQILDEVRTIDDDSQMIVVNGSIFTLKNDWTCSAWMNSALVTPSGGRSLLHALTDDQGQPQNLPYADAGISSWDEIDAPGMQLRGWLVTQGPDHEGMDGHDPLARGLERRLTYPSPDTAAMLGLTPNEVGNIFTDASGALGARIHCWSEEDGFRRTGHAPHSSSGDYLVIRRDLLYGFLAERQFCIVAVVHAGLSHSPAGGSSGRERRHTATRYLLINPDGTEEHLDAQPD